MKPRLGRNHDSDAGELPKPLRRLVSWSSETLGEAVREYWGEAAFLRIEKVRRDMAKLRGAPSPSVHRALASALKSYRKMSDADLEQITRSFSVLLELINCCEAAYRNARLKEKRGGPGPGSLKRKFPVRLVMTSHPTESRRPESVFVFQSIQALLESSLAFDTPSKPQIEHLKNLLTILLKISMFKERRPGVADEARYLASIILREEILDAILLEFSEDFDLRLRTWVGGDKDGHPGVDQKALVKSLETFRAGFLAYIKRQIGQLAYQMGTAHQFELKRELGRFEKRIFAVARIRRGDARQLARFWADFERLEAAFDKSLVGVPIQMQRVRRLRMLFPALVVPLELREASEVIEEILSAKLPERFALTRMLDTLDSISSGGNILRYAQALVVSHVRNEDDVFNALKLTRSRLGSPVLPVVPLFEDEAALLRSREILAEVFKNHGFRTTLKTKWRNRFEIMLGYSDSAKESGLMYSKLLIQKTMFDARDLCKKLGIHPVFFNGSGGSVARGGGNLEEQTAWWAREAFDPYKATIQGEMVQRSFASPEILGSFLYKLPKLLAGHPGREKRPEAKALWALATRAKVIYRTTVEDPEFLRLIETSTVYPFLSLLRLGSRPSKRNRIGGISTLRAIPWVMTWTQARLLLPNWWGLGSAWAAATPAERRQLTTIYRTNPLLSSFMKQLGFTLAKVELPVWRLYLEHAPARGGNVWHYKIFEEEFRLTQKFLRELTGQRDLLWFRPWLGESIYLRSPMIFPLNLAQLVAMERKSVPLLRESVVGIACGMMTTG